MELPATLLRLVSHLTRVGLVRVAVLCAVVGVVTAGCTGTVDRDGSDVTGGVTTPEASVLASTTQPSTTGDGAVAASLAEGWRFTEIPFTVREGSAYAVGGGWFFTWGGAADRSGNLMGDGLLVEVDTGEWSAVPTAPIEARYSAAAVWTGDEFVVIGGHSFEESLIDGAAFDPVERTWRQIVDPPISSASYPSAVWTGTELVVWLAGNDSEFASLPTGSVGQLAAYDPSSDSWSLLGAPDEPMVDAVPLMSNGRLVVVGGPPMRDLGTIGRDGGVKASIQDPDTGVWGDALIGPVVESARPFILGDGTVAVLTSDGSVLVLTESGWETGADLPEVCPLDLGATAGRGSIYLKNCSTFLLDGASPRLLLGHDQYGSTSNLYGAAFLSTQDGLLVTFSSADPAQVTSDTSVFGVYDDPT